MFGDLNIGLTESGTEPFLSVVIDVDVFDKPVVDTSGSNGVDVCGRTVEGDCDC